MDEYAFVDYRKKDAIEVKAVGENYEVTLKLFAKLNTPDSTVDTVELLKNWCEQWTVDEVATEFKYVYKVLWYSWVSPCVFQMVIARPRGFGEKAFTTEDGVKQWFLDDSLEDGAYEGYANFWVIPSSQKRICVDDE